MNLILLSPNFVLCILDEIKWNKVNSDAENAGCKETASKSQLMEAKRD